MRLFREAFSVLSGGLLVLAAIAGQAQTLNTVVQHSAALSVTIVEPHSVTIDGGSGLIYFTDAGGIPGFGESAHRVMVYDSAKSQLAVLAGDLLGRNGTNSGVGFNARFFNPAGIVVARGGLVVADSGNHLIRHVAFNGTVTNIAGGALQPGHTDAIGGAARFNTPLGLAVDSAGNIFVADSKNNVIRRIAPDNTVTTYATGFNQPNGLSAGANGDLWVADTLNHQIKVIDSGGVVTVRAGQGVAGFADAFPDAAGALLSSPRGVFWMGDAGLLISDSGNHVVRRLYTNAATGTFSIETSVGAAGEAGFANGASASARLSTPLGLSGDVLNGAFLVIDVGNRAIRRVQQTQALPPVGNPRIGYVVLAEDSVGNITARLQDVTHSVFNNEVPIQIVAETGVDTFYTFGGTPTNVFVDTVPDPSPASLNATSFVEGGATLPGSIIQNVEADMTLKAQSSQAGRQSSDIISARFQFKVGNPEVVGDNAAAFELNNVTTNAQMFYTIDGSEPTNGPPSVGPVTPGTSLSFNLTSSNLLFKAKAFRTGFEPSATISNLFSATDFEANRISFGFASGVASSGFEAAAGSTYYAPVTLTLLEGVELMFSLQFSLLVTNDTGPAVTPGAVNFDSGLFELLDDGTFRKIPPRMFVGTFTTNAIPITTNTFITNVTANMTNLLVTNAGINLLSVGWLETRLGTNVFNSFNQTLISFSLAHDHVFTSADNKIVVGGFAFQVPATATNGQEYRIRIIRPSGTLDGIHNDVFIDAPTNGALRAASPINALRHVTVGSPKYLIGDVHPFRWWNAGDFGDTNLLNVDVLQVFRTMAYGLNAPLPSSDFEDAMDSCCGTATLDASTGYLTNNGGTISTATIQQGGNTTINSSVFGDGTLDIADLWVTFRRSLDPTLTNYLRFRSNGVHYAVSTPNLFRGQSVDADAAVIASTAGGVTRQRASTGTTAGAGRVFFSADSVVATAGDLVAIPIRAKVTGALPLRLLALNLNVLPVLGSDPSVPRLSEPAVFLPGTALGDPSLSTSEGTHNVALAWLNPDVAGVLGDGVIGHLQFRVPAGAGPNAAYSVHIEHASGSSFGLDRLPDEETSGLVSMVDRSGTNTVDGISQEWRMRHFRVAAIAQNVLSAPLADADGDGLLNWQEYRAGTNPNQRDSTLNVRAEAAGPVRLRWPTRDGRRYVIEYTESLVGGDWHPAAPQMEGNGADAEFTVSSGGVPRYYRVRLVEP